MIKQQNVDYKQQHFLLPNSRHASKQWVKSGCAILVLGPIAVRSCHCVGTLGMEMVWAYRVSVQRISMPSISCASTEVIRYCTPRTAFSMVWHTLGKVLLAGANSSTYRLMKIRFCIIDSFGIHEMMSYVDKNKNQEETWT